MLAAQMYKDENIFVLQIIKAVNYFRTRVNLAEACHIGIQNNIANMQFGGYMVIQFRCVDVVLLDINKLLESLKTQEEKS